MRNFQNLLSCLSIVFKSIFFTLVLKDISINQYMKTSICTSGNEIKLCKYGKSSCHGNCFIEPGKFVHFVLLLGNRL